MLGVPVGWKDVAGGARADDGEDVEDGVDDEGLGVVGVKVGFVMRSVAAYGGVVAGVLGKGVS